MEVSLHEVLGYGWLAHLTNVVLQPSMVSNAWECMACHMSPKMSSSVLDG